MIRSSIEKDFTPKKEDETNDGKNPQEPSSSRTWSALRDSRIVRVSSSFGGKDRHSKVRTIKGLRDRRIRLSAPTAIQLYDLQERLGLNQPSKVIDWLLNAAQHAIDELPPLQMPAENCVQYSQPKAMSHEVTTQPNIRSRNDMFGTDQITLPKTMYWNSHEPLRAKFKDVMRETMVEKSVWMKRTEHQNQEPSEDHSAEKWDHSSLPRPYHSFFAGSLNNVVPYTAYYHTGLPSTAPVSYIEAHGSSSQTEDLYDCATIPLPSSFAPPSGSQLLFYPSGTTPSIIPTYIAPPNDLDPKQITNFQMLSSSSQNLQPNYVTTRATQLSIAPSHHHSLNNHVSQSNAFGDRHQQS